jgi:hypothetical protein
LYISCNWLPELIPYGEDISFPEYFDVLYEIFRADFIISKPIYRSLPVNIRKEPREKDGREHAFIHLTHEDIDKKGKNPNDRIPDLRRCERIKWPKKVIENFFCNDKCDCSRLFW